MGEKIYKARKAKGFSQERLSELVGVSRQTISQWENDKFQPSSDNIDVLCRVLGVSREEFLEKTSSVSEARPTKILTILIAICSALIALMTIITVILGFICLTDNTGDMMDNSYSIPKYAFFVALAVTLILLLADVAIIILKVKHRRS